MIMQLDKAVKQMQSESVLKMQFELSVPAAGFESNAVRRLIVTFGRAKDFQIAPIAMLLHIYQTADT